MDITLAELQRFKGGVVCEGDNGRQMSSGDIEVIGVGTTHDTSSITYLFNGARTTVEVRLAGIQRCGDSRVVTTSTDGDRVIIAKQDPSDKKRYDIDDVVYGS